MATNDVHITVSDNNVSVPLTISGGRSLRTVTPQSGSPYYVGARAYVTQTENGATVTVIDKEGTTTAVILNGTNGIDGQDGADGADGNGIVDISLTSSAANVDEYTITYDNGSTETFYVTNGIDGADGQDGADGADGADGFSPIATVSKVGDTATISITDENGTTTATISDGTDGTDGQDGTDGADGFSPSATVSKSGDTATISITDKDGTTTTTITDGEDGRDGTDGTDGVDGVGIVSITKTATVGLVDTYTILYSDGTTSTFDVTNGQNGSGSVADVWVDGSSVLDGDTAKIDLTGKSDVGHTHTKSAITDFPTLATVATSGSYNDLLNKPTIPTVNNATLTIQKNGTNVQTFTANSSSNKTANITVPTKTSDLTNDSGFITGYTETDPVFSASAASGITASDISNWNGKSPNVVYCTCSTASGTAAKVATIESGSLSSLNKGDQAIVKFTNANGVASPTLKIGTTDAKSIKRYGTTAPSTSAATSWNAGSCVYFVYDGTYWQMTGFLNTTYSEISEANITNGSGSTTGLITGRRAKKAVETFAPIQDVTVGGTSVMSGTTAVVPAIPTDTGDLTNGAGYITGYTETDPVFSASAASGITSSDISAWYDKSDFSGDYDDLTNKPTIPTDTADLANGAGFITAGAFEISTVAMSVTVPSNDVNNKTVTATKSGYYPLGIVGWHTSGTGVTLGELYRFYPTNAALGSIDINAYFRNGYTSSQTYTLTAYVLWVKAS